MLYFRKAVGSGISGQLFFGQPDQTRLQSRVPNSRTCVLVVVSCLQKFHGYGKKCIESVVNEEVKLIASSHAPREGEQDRGKENYSNRGPTRLGKVAEREEKNGTS